MKKTIKWVSILLAATLVMTALAGCSAGGGIIKPAGTNDAAVSPGTASSPETAQDNTSTPETPTSATGGLPENLADLTITLEGDTITLPMPLEGFFTLGWELDEFFGISLEETIEPKKFKSIIFVKGDQTFSVYTANLQDDQVITVRQSIVFRLFLSDAATVELPVGIKLGVSVIEDAASAYGEPSRINEDENIMTYAKADYTVYIIFDPDSGVINKTTISSNAF